MAVSVFVFEDVYRDRHVHVCKPALQSVFYDLVAQCARALELRPSAYMGNKREPMTPLFTPIIGVAISLMFALQYAPHFPFDSISSFE